MQTKTLTQKVLSSVDAHGQNVSVVTQNKCDATNIKSSAIYSIQPSTNVTVVNVANSTSLNAAATAAPHSMSAAQSKATLTTDDTDKTLHQTTACNVNDKQMPIVDNTTLSTVGKTNNNAPSCILSPKQRNDGNNGKHVSTRFKSNESSKTAFAVVASATATTESKYAELKAAGSSVVSEFASDASLIRYGNTKKKHKNSKINQNKNS